MFRFLVKYAGIAIIIGFPASLYAQMAVPGPVQPSNQQPTDFTGYPKPVSGPTATPTPVDNTQKINQLKQLNEGNKQVIQQIKESNNPVRMAPAELYYQNRINNTNKQIEKLQNESK
jgi:hypothetical protein